MQLRSLMSHCRKNLVGDKVIGKKWISVERNTLYRQSVGHLRRRAWPRDVVWLAFMGWVISSTNEWEGYSSYFGEGVKISRNWATAYFLVFDDWPQNCHDACECVIQRVDVLQWACYTENLGLVEVNSSPNLISFCPVFSVCHSLKGYDLPPSLLFLNNHTHFLRFPWTARSNQSILKEISPYYSLEEQLKSLLMKVKEESEKVDLKLNIQKTNIMASGPITPWQIEGQERDFILGAPKSLQMVTAAMRLRCLLLGRKAMTNVDSILKSRDITLPTKVKARGRKELDTIEQLN